MLCHYSGIESKINICHMNAASHQLQNAMDRMRRKKRKLESLPLSRPLCVFTLEKFILLMKRYIESNFRLFVRSSSSLCVCDGECTNNSYVSTMYEQRPHTHTQAAQSAQKNLIVLSVKNLLIKLFQTNRNDRRAERNQPRQMTTEMTTEEMWQTMCGIEKS